MKGNFIMKKTIARRRNRFAGKLEDAINESDLTQFELAKRLGYENANIISMFKKGTTRVPLDKVAPLARILNLDPGELLREWFHTYYPDALPAIEEHMGLVLTGAEKSWIRGIRRHLGAAPRFDDRWGASLATLVDDS
jgi:hypothetical protein